MLLGHFSIFCTLEGFLHFIMENDVMQSPYYNCTNLQFLKHSRHSYAIKTILSLTPNITNCHPDTSKYYVTCSFEICLGF